MLQKNAFGQKNSNVMHGFKIAILEKLKNCQNGTFEPPYEFFFAKKALVRIEKNVFVLGSYESLERLKV